jgi:hypothetical protein
LQQNIAQAAPPTSNQTLLLSSDHTASLLQQHGASNLGIGNLISGLPPQSNNLNVAASVIQQSQLINQLGAPIRQSNNLLNSTNNSRQPGAQNLNDNISPPQSMMVNLGGSGGGQSQNHMMGQQQLLLTNGPNPGPNSLLFRPNGLGPNLNQKPSQLHQQQLNLNNSPNNGNISNIHSQMIQQQRIQQQSLLQQQQMNNRPEMLKIPIYNTSSNTNSANNNSNNTNRNSQVIDA